ncbi:probable beta-hexosaminidase fdl isoform X2 [Trichogramma pretiosum]|uniref:probable beta-hexosaminidase fdl isoform X2 n=1 Tax=Trichogramma pretiosum TaxID=7493 RepID=UPI000C71B018|nr:probable beta-hexosaminidase fdl isoform X2 [Trichogramma pretiosum]XP_023318104.1 probable beta-hexosaminidase fdl isoform X2 [Trichogramma pretiosum]
MASYYDTLLGGGGGGGGVRGYYYASEQRLVRRQALVRLARMVGGLPSGWMRRVLLFLVLITGCLVIAMFARSPPLASLQPFTAQRTFQSPWSWACVAGRCERRAVRSSRISLSTCQALCGSASSRLLWPKPSRRVELGRDSSAFHWQQIEFAVVDTDSAEVRAMLDNAKDVFLGNVRSLMKIPNTKSRSSLDSFVVAVTVTSAKDTKLTLATDESYELQLATRGKHLEARVVGRTYYGVRHGLETLSQMIWWDENCGKQGCLRVLSSAIVDDKPVFEYRGLLVDTGRQFFPVEQLKNVIDGMAASKLNTLHWHLSDSQSFPYDSQQFPEMARWGAYSGDEIYSPEDIKDLALYARIRGVRILIEIDSPAHAGAGWQWGLEHGLGELALCVDQQPWTAYCGEPNCGQLNPINENTYKILEGLYRELLDLTEVRDVVHLGGDEVNLECWAQYNNITAVMQAQNMTDYHVLWAEFERKLHSKLIRANRGEAPKAVILWSSPLTKRPYLQQYFDPQVHVIQSWGGSNWPDTTDILEDGFRVILSHVDAWYLDCGFGKWREQGEAACGEYRTWQTVYNHRPWRDYAQQHMRQIVGGEAAIWSEQLGQASLGPRLWPRASALAERLWSDIPSSGYNVDENVYTRLSSHIELLRSRGVKTEAMWPHWCTQNPGKCL